MTIPTSAHDNLEEEVLLLASTSHYTTARGEGSGKTLANSWQNEMCRWYCSHPKSSQACQVSASPKLVTDYCTEMEQSTLCAFFHVS